MNVERLVEAIGAEYYAGVPDSQLKALCNYLMARYGIDPRHHVIAANEGNAAALAAGYHLATGKVPAVYLQNSGLGNIVNPVCSLLNEAVYGIPCVFLVGWRGEPGTPDEPQHAFQGEVTQALLEDLGIRCFVLSRETTPAELEAAVDGFRPLLAAGKQVAVLVRKGALQYEGAAAYGNGYAMRREEVIRRVAEASGADVIVSTTGKASRELYEIRESKGQGHERDFLTVGSMGHSSSIALGIAAQRPDARVWILDGDGAALMHMGAMAVLGASAARNVVHVVINNEAHESVGGMPTAAGKVDLVRIAEGCGYARAVRVDSYDALERELAEAKGRRELAFIEARCAIGARENLGRPATTPQENKRAFMEYLAKSRGKEPV